jgi:hypothetical protein
MTDLEVDLGLLERTAGSLSMLIEEFDNYSKVVTSAQSAVREAALVAALDSFAGNWAAHRQDLLSSMQAVCKMATESRKAYVETDDSLARDIRQDGTP